MESPHGIGLVRVLLPPKIVPETVCGEFGLLCQRVDEAVGRLTTSAQQAALLKFLQAHVGSALAVIELARDEP